VRRDIYPDFLKRTTRHFELKTLYWNQVLQSTNQPERNISVKTRLFSTLLLALAFALSVAVAGEKGDKSAKTTSTKKEMKGCCADDMKSAKAYSDKDMKHCDTKGAKASTKSDAKAEVKTENKNAEVK
jgi:hypothetical protein